MKEQRFKSKRAGTRDVPKPDPFAEFKDEDGVISAVDHANSMRMIRGGRGQRGQTIAEYFSAIRRKRDEDKRRQIAARLAMEEEEEWLGLPEVQAAAPPQDTAHDAWAARMRGSGWVEESPGNWVAPRSAAAAGLVGREEDTWSPW